MFVSDQTIQQLLAVGAEQRDKCSQASREEDRVTLKTCVSSAAESMGVLSTASVFLWKQKSGSQYRVRMEEEELEC